jgi:FkbM family methyltransferase
MSTSPFVSYAQNAEDVVLARALRPDESEGFYVDVGAGHPVIDSVTKAFSERGWRGINVEPLAEEHALLAEDRPRDVNLNVALGAVSGTVKLFAGPPENRGASTIVPEYADAYRSQGQEFVAREVRLRTLAQVADEHVAGTVDFLKVDVEGLESEVLEGADWEWFRPRVVVVEATVPNSTEQAHLVWEPRLLAQGYELALFDGLNRFYARADEPDLRDRLAVPANVLDDFVPHAWLERVTNAEALAEGRRARVDELGAELAEQARLARHLRSEVSTAQVDLAELVGALAAAQLRTARALGASHRDAQLAASRGEALAELQATRTFRYSAGARTFYGHLRRLARASRKR